MRVYMYICVAVGFNHVLTSPIAEQVLQKAADDGSLDPCVLLVCVH